jgi:hypothetical protein
MANSAVNCAVMDSSDFGDFGAKPLEAQWREAGLYLFYF